MDLSGVGWSGCGGVDGAAWVWEIVVQCVEGGREVVMRCGGDVWRWCVAVGCSGGVCR